MKVRKFQLHSDGKMPVMCSTTKIGCKQYQRLYVEQNLVVNNTKYCIVESKLVVNSTKDCIVEPNLV